MVSRKRIYVALDNGHSGRYWETGGDLNENGDKGKMWTSYLVDQIAQAAPNTERNGR